MIRAAILLLASTATLSACATSDANSYSKARTAIERADDAYARIRVRADAALPKLPPAAARRVGAGLAIADMALALARASTDPAERTQSLARAAAAVADVVTAIAAYR